MKKCPQCVVFYKKNDRTHCIFCNGVLQSLTVDELTRIVSEQAQREKATRAQAEVSSFIEHAKMSPFLKSYYGKLSFAESYRFCRYQMKKGKSFPRFFVQPLSPMALVKIPWFFIDCIDSILLHALAKNYCERCDCKYVPITGQTVHNPKECEYNRDYQNVLEKVFAGEIFILEQELWEQSQARLKAGQQSAYADLIAYREGKKNAEDVWIVLISAAIVFAALAAIVMPLLKQFYYLMYT